MGIERIQQAFQKGRAAFMPYMALGYPSQEESLRMIRSLADCGADLLELGVPFSDPLADGPVIQAATQQALQNGVNVAKCLEMVRQLRREGMDTPALLMSYYNPLLTYGIQRCAADSAAAGVDGFIIPDLPPEEAAEMEAVCREHGLALVFLLSPNSPPERIALVAQKSTGFIYLVSLTGVTGARKELPPDLAAFVARVRAAAHQPLAVGFGISNGEQAALVSRLADGVIVGSALVQRSGESPEALTALATELRHALDTI